MINTEIVLWAPLRFWHGATRGLNPALHRPRCLGWDRYVLKQSLVVVFTARCHASAVPAMGLCLSVSVSVCLCLSQVGVLLKRLNIRSHKQHNTIVQGLYFSVAKDLREIRPGSPPTGAPNAGGVGQNRLRDTFCISFPNFIKIGQNVTEISRFL